MHGGLSGLMNGEPVMEKKKLYCTQSFIKRTFRHTVGVETYSIDYTTIIFAIVISNLTVKH